MNRAVIKANLPENVRHVLVGKKYEALLRKPIEAIGLIPVFLEDNQKVDPRLSGHVDLSCVYLGDGRMLLPTEYRNLKSAEIIHKLGIKIKYLDINISEKYPDDAKLNICQLGGTLICNSNNSSEAAAELSGVERVINVNQGYSRCSVCIVDENSIITADRGIHSGALESGLDSLLIAPGHIALDGFEYGFIGGSSFKLGRERLVFTGTLDKHPDRAEILGFLKKKNVFPVFLTDQPAFDIGSAIPLTEK